MIEGESELLFTYSANKAIDEYNLVGSHDIHTMYIC